MSLLKRRKSPNPLKFSVRKVIVRKPPKHSKPPQTPKSHKKPETQKTSIVNPITTRKINLGGTTHLRLIKEKVLDGDGKDIRKKVVKVKTQISDDVVGTIMSFLPTKIIPKVAKQHQRYAKKALLHHSFDISDSEACLAFSKSDIKLLIRNPNIKKQSLFKCVVMRGFHLLVRELLKAEYASALGRERVDPSDNKNEAIISASENGLYLVVRELLKDKRVDPGADKNEAIGLAAEYGRLQVVKELLKDKRVDPGDDDNKAIRRASRNGHVLIVKELLKNQRVDPGANKNEAINLASLHGHYLVVRELLKDKRVNPIDNDNKAVYTAFQLGHSKVITELMGDDRVKTAYDADVDKGKDEDIDDIELPWGW